MSTLIASELMMLGTTNPRIGIDWAGVPAAT